MPRRAPLWCTWPPLADTMGVPCVPIAGQGVGRCAAATPGDKAKMRTCETFGGAQMSSTSVSDVLASPVWQHPRDLLRLNRSKAGTPYSLPMVSHVSPQPTLCRIAVPLGPRMLP
jgi:hypothetical protein